MIVRTLYIPEYDWTLVVFYGIMEKDLPKVLYTLWVNNCPNRDIRVVALTLVSQNTGFTYTNQYTKVSIMGIGHTTSTKEFVNTVVHEIKHFQTEVCYHYNIPQDGEQAALICGNTAMLMYSDLNNQ